MSHELAVERSGTTLVLTLDRPDKMNALSATLVDALLLSLEQAAHDGTRLVVLRGNGRCFSAGFDMSDVKTQSHGDLLLRFVRIEQLLQAIFHAPFETLALAHGRNFGAGADIVAACSRRVGSTDSAFRMPGLQFGLVLGTRRLAARVGNGVARDTLERGLMFGADAALSMGFLTATIEREMWPEAIADAAAADKLSPRSRRALYDATAPDTRDVDLVSLVQSAAAPGLHERIETYLTSVQTAKRAAGA